MSEVEAYVPTCEWCHVCAFGDYIVNASFIQDNDDDPPTGVTCMAPPNLDGANTTTNISYSPDGYNFYTLEGENAFDYYICSRDFFNRVCSDLGSCERGGACECRLRYEGDVCEVGTFELV